MNGRRIRKRTVSASSVKAFHFRNPELRHNFEDEFTQVAWGADLGLAEPAAVEAPIYTLFDRRTVQEGQAPWVWEYRGRYLDGQESHWLQEEEALDNFTPLQLDVFHALWDLLQPNESPRPAESPSKEQRDKEIRDKAL